MRTMLRVMTWPDFLAWSDYYAVEPFGEIRADLRAGEVVAAVYNVNRDPNKTKALGPADVMPYLRAQRDEAAEDRVGGMSWDALLGKYRGYAAQVEASGGKVVHDG